MLAPLTLICLIRTSLVSAWIQTPKIEDCSDLQVFRLSNVTIKDATISKTMTVRFTITLNETLGDNPKLKLVLRKKNGMKIPCFLGYGSCTYKLCDGTTEQERALTQMWENHCPVPVFEETPSIDAKVIPSIQLVTGLAPTTITIGFKVTNGGSIVGCQSLKVKIKRGKRKRAHGVMENATGLEE
ncbi:uncharacterized protein [Dermacentor andersoni]|uniref:uncharacterized protein isoform X1 n=1 Tax=Dermacentor andersoni TaxID=34620 RepID=UPI0024160A3C|nr:uncharacterized protein LOC126544782 isoform X1 [Dermacentor andersoni]